MCRTLIETLKEAEVSFAKNVEGYECKNANKKGKVI